MKGGTMIERAAKKIEEAYFAHGMHHNGGPMRGDYEFLARAAIEAMRTPTDALMVASVSAGMHWSKVEAGWTAMVDAILAEQP